MVPRRRRALLALAFYGLATMLLSAPLVAHVSSTVARAVRQDVWLNIWALAWTSDHLLAGPTTLFDANIFFPHPHTLAYTDHFIGQALLSAPIYAISGSAVLAYNVAWFAALILTAWGGYLWVRALIGDEPAGEAAALVAGAVCLLVPGKRTALSHLQVISLQGVTLSLFAAHLLLQRASWQRAVALTAATVYAALSSWYTAAYMALLLPFVGGAGVLMTTTGTQRRRALAYGVGALLLAAAIMYPVARPYRAVQSEMEFERPLDELVATSLAPVDFVSSWSWLHTGRMPEGSGAGGYFPGFVAFALALIGLLQGWRRREPWPLVYGAGAALFCVLALGPRLAISEGRSLPLPYELLFRFVPGWGALRNPYRAAFIASILLAVPVGYGARALIERARASVLRRQRWNVRPRLGALPVATWALAVTLAGAHLFEAWPGPQEIASLPSPQSGAYAWLAREDPGAAALVVPLPRPFDDNARYQLWTVGDWVPLVNGHSGLYPADFLELYRAGAEFPEPGFLRVLKERFPVRYVVAHYGLMEDGAAVRAAAAETGIEEAYAEKEDVVYRIGNGADGGWARRRMPARMIGERMIVDAGPSAAGCGFRLLVNEEIAGEVGVEDIQFVAERARSVAEGEAAGFEAATGNGYASFTVEIADAQSGSDVLLEMYFVRSDGLPRVDLRATLMPVRRAGLSINGVPHLEGPVVVGVLDGANGHLTFARASSADEAGAGGALRQALQAASPGDELVLAIAEDLDYALIERLRLLLDAAGAPAAAATLDDLGTTYAFRGRIGSPPGSALEVAGEEGVELFEPDPESDCRLSPIGGFEMVGAGRRR